MNQKVRELAEHLLQTGFEDLPERERRVISRIAKRLQISQNLNRVFDERLTFGQRMSDRLSAFGGSWTFIILFAVVLAVWIVLNSVLLVSWQGVFDPYPYVFLNLILSMLAAIQAPIIMMSQNRQAAKDRLAASNDYEVNLKAELEILRLHEKMDELRQSQLTSLLEKQDEQILLIRQLLGSGEPASS